jgi:hypothetical protein
MSRRVTLSVLLFSAAAPLAAQTTVAPTGEPTGPPRGENIGNYNLMQTWETGYRFHSVAGSEGKYRSDVNFRNGVRLLGSRLSLNSKDGHGRLFDELVLTTQGMGNDPYEFAGVRIARNRLYRYDMLWRSNEYLNPALAIARGLHGIDTSRRLQDHDFTLLPQSSFRLFAGYSRVSQSGAALVTGQFFSQSDDEYPLFAGVDRLQQEVRGGAEANLSGVRLNLAYARETYRESTPIDLLAPSKGNNPADQSALSRLERREPWSGETPSYRLNLFRERSRRWALSGRLTHSAGRRDFAFNETAAGLDRFGDARNRQIAAGGNARRPVTTGHLTLSIFPGGALTLVNHTGFHHTRMEGDSEYREIENGDLTGRSVRFQFLGIRNVTNLTDASVRFSKRLTLRGGYQFANRRIRSVERSDSGSGAAQVSAEQDNTLHAVTAGFRLQAAQSLTLMADGEIGRSNRPFYVTSEKDYHAYSARMLFKRRSVTLTALARAGANFNSSSLVSHSSRARTYSFDGSWNARDWLSLDAGYSYLASETATGLVYFAAGSRVAGESSLWVSRLHAAQFGIRLEPASRVSLWLGYSRTEDTGDGRAALVTPPPGAAQGSALAAFRAAQTFPMRFESPLARLSVRIHQNLRWNGGWQYYGYGERWLPQIGYRAHTGYTSLLWSF